MTTVAVQVLFIQNRRHNRVNKIRPQRQFAGVTSDREVTSIAEDLGFECYYTDTDSIRVDLEARAPESNQRPIGVACQKLPAPMGNPIWVVNGEVMAQYADVS